MSDRETWDRVGKNDPYCGTGGPTRAVPAIGQFAKPDSAVLEAVKGKSVVLDLGCGYGRNSVALMRRNVNVIASDWSLAMSRTVREAKIPFIVCDAGHLPFRDHSIDCLVCSHVVQHLPRKKMHGVLAEIERVAKQSLIVVPNPLGTASLLGLRPLLHTLAMAKNRKGRRTFEDLPTLRGYIVNYYLQRNFVSLAKNFFDNVTVKPGMAGERLPAFFTNSLLYICS